MPPAPETAAAACAAPTGLGALARWAGAQAEPLKLLAQGRDADAAMLDRGLERVRAFIAARGLVVFGGQAVDYALRLRGARLYPDEQSPDYDVLSPRSVDDAYDLAEELQRAGFAHVGAIRAIHVQTMRVRADFRYLADIGYAPPEVFARIPTLEFRGVRFVHPDFQRMDQHLAFCFPFSGAPREDVFHRWRKDLARFNLLDAHYPFAAEEAGAPPLPGAKRAPAPPAATGGAKSGARPGAGGAAALTARLAVPVTAAAGAPEPSVALHGFAAYAVLRAALGELEEARGRAPCAAPRLALSFPDAQSFTVEVPAGGAAHVATPEPDAAVAGLGGQWREPWLDVAPPSLAAGPLVVWSTRGRQLAVAAAPVAGGRRALVVTPQYLLLFFLLEAIRAERPEDRASFRAYYRHTLDILAAAEGAAAGDDALRAVFAASPFAPPVTVLGATNHSPAYEVLIAGAAQDVGDTPPASLHLAPNLAARLAGLPRPYHPGPGKDGRPKPRPVFDYGGCPLFRRAGQPVAPGAAVGGSQEPFAPFVREEGEDDEDFPGAPVD